VAERPAWIRAAEPAVAAGALLAEHLERVDRERGAARLAIPGGSALTAVAALRGQLGASGDLWARVRLTWVDERCVPEANNASNRGDAARRGLLNGPAPADVLPLYLDDETGVQAVARVDAALASRFESGLDVLLLGMGEDGHVASLFPGGPAPSGARVAHVTASPKPPPERITLTRAFLGRARHTVLLAAGEGKRSALERLNAGDTSLPAHGLPGLTLVTDLTLEPDAGGNR
jgi:6-phosphogluconolactonase